MPEAAAVLIRFSSPLRKRTGGLDRFAVNGECVADALSALERQYPGILGGLLDAGGVLSPQIRIFLGAADIRMLEGLSTPLENDDILFITSVAGMPP